MSELREVTRGLTAVASPLVPLLLALSLVRPPCQTGLSLSDQVVARVGLHLSVQRDEREGEEDTGQLEEAAPAHGGPEPVEGLHHLLADGHHGGVVAGAEGGAEPNLSLDPGAHPADVGVDDVHYPRSRPRTGRSGW